MTAERLKSSAELQVVAQGLRDKNQMQDRTRIFFLRSSRSSFLFLRFIPLLLKTFRSQMVHSNGLKPFCASSLHRKQIIDLQSVWSRASSNKELSIISMTSTGAKSHQYQSQHLDPKLMLLMSTSLLNSVFYPPMLPSTLFLLNQLH